MVTVIYAINTNIPAKSEPEDIIISITANELKTGLPFKITGEFYISYDAAYCVAFDLIEDQCK